MTDEQRAKVAEVRESVSEHIDCDCSRCILLAAMDDAEQRAADAERRIVAWLRERNVEYRVPPLGAQLSAADAIERGECREGK